MKANRGELPESVSEALARQARLRENSRFSDFWALIGCNAIVFATSVCLMVLELTASRLIAGYLGSSLYTWTSVIGVVLAGISLGNFAGGWLADRYSPQKLLGWLFVLAGMLTLSVLLLNNLMARAPRPEGLNWQWWVMLVVACEFLLPAVSLGTISPVVASMALKRSARTGITVGNIYAWGALGSIVGTFITGFWLIGAYGTKQIIWMTAGALLLMGVLVAGGQRTFRMVVMFGLMQFLLIVGILSSTTAYRTSEAIRTLAGIGSFWSTGEEDFASDDAALKAASETNDEPALAAARERRLWRTKRKTSEDEWGTWGFGLGAQLHELGRTLALRFDDPRDYNDESDYFAINISSGVADGDPIKQLRLDFLIHSYFNPENPTRLYYDYERVYAAVTERAADHWDRRTDVALEQLPTGDRLDGNLPAGVRHDPTDRRLSVQGGMTFAELRELVAVGDAGEFRKALLALWETADRDGSKAMRNNGGKIAVPVRGLPAGVLFPEDLAIPVRYDSEADSLTCTAQFSLEQALALMAQGADAPYVRAVAELYRRSRRTSTMFIGGGGFVFPRWIESRFPHEPRIDVAEIDPAVKLAVENEMGLPAEFGPPEEGKTYVRTHLGDARKFVDERLRENERLRAAHQPPVTYDFVYGDAFNDLSVPWHLTTREFGRKIHDLLTPGEGVYLVNVIDIIPRAQYPEKSARVEAAVVEFTGNVPASLLPHNLPQGQYVRVRGPFPKLEISRTGNVHQLRYLGSMTKPIRDALKQIDETDPDRSRFALAIDRLFEKTRQRQFLSDPPPPALFPGPLPIDEWFPAAGEFRSLEVYRNENGGLIYGFRGIMDNVRRDKLLALSAGNPSYETAIRALQRQSQTEAAGQFLGRYVKTARENFPNVYVFTSNESDAQPGDNRDTYIVACSLKKLDFADLKQAGGHWRSGPFASSESDRDGRLVDEGSMAALLELSRGKVLEDNFAPVDNLLAPVFVLRSED